MAKMDLNNLVTKKPEWLRGEGPRSDIVMSTRVRLARNLDGYPFFSWANAEQRKNVLEKLVSVFKKNDLLKNTVLIRIKDISEIDREFLVERHLMSQEHAVCVEQKGLVVGDGEMLSIMINEEDHLRMQILRSGLNITEAWRIIDALDTSLGEALTFAYSNRFGYLTACPTNTGTGMRASLLMHLPALVISEEINRVLQALNKVGIVARGLYGEGTKVMGDLFQISNQVTLGSIEKGIVDNLERVAKQVIEYEMKERKSIFKNEREKIEDLVYRAYGVLSNAHKISFSEAMELFSKVRLGIYLGLHVDTRLETINKLMIFTQPAHLQESEGKELSVSQRDIVRARIIREKLKHG